ncbi:MAG: hypothetical protein JJ909_06320 [Roseivirga sp.]|uniref:hypothetical protein n=1 Tax=Roseivirga sp. TaxID=1964215 RepID=UPI001B07B645|nr:hypothetical protein [Roseivirga sp.]MBO6661162.1 hypothetical protein [Roseivirga sp.]MBO6760569.1 hypothetical protein [Roseivirga sp.]MBO6908854.1 hypothetical protein [Roseivirga sp.]
MKNQYLGMTVNERLWASGLMSEFDIAKKQNLQRAVSILEELKVDRESMLKILKVKHNIPTKDLIKAFCHFYSKNALAEVEHYNVSWINRRRLTLKKRVDRFFVFSHNELFSFLDDNTKICKRVVQESLDKRVTPSSFIQESTTHYKVGLYDNDYLEVKEWSKLSLAISDYLFLSWNLPRLNQ